ncbi:hypothetical protein SUGI_1028020 [Cryptomeria japonica]|nr:hypothetical protein SUGI_1028020 [Cryptomeria japonica]
MQQSLAERLCKFKVFLGPVVDDTDFSDREDYNAYDYEYDSLSYREYDYYQWLYEEDLDESGDEWDEDLDGIYSWEWMRAESQMQSMGMIEGFYTPLRYGSHTRNRDYMIHTWLLDFVLNQFKIFLLVFRKIFKVEMECGI